MSTETKKFELFKGLELIYLYDFLFKAAFTEKTDRFVKWSFISSKTNSILKKRKDYPDSLLELMKLANEKLAKDFKIFMERKFGETMPNLDPEHKKVTMHIFLSEVRVPMLVKIVEQGFTDFNPLDFLGFEPGFGIACLQNQKAFESFVRMLVLEEIEREAGFSYNFKNIRFSEQREVLNAIFGTVFNRVLQEVDDEVFEK
jgi:hypothetical protein